MRNEFSKVKKWDLSKWIVTQFYHYTSCAKEIIHEYDTVWHTRPVGDPYVKELYDHFLKVADAYLNMHYGDMPGHGFASLGNQNKTTIETGDVLFLTQYDGRYYIGKSVWSEFGAHEVFGIKRKPDFTARDCGHVKEIKNHLSKIEEDYGLTLTEEKKWLDNLAERRYK